MSSTETIKINSKGLRGTLAESLKDQVTGAIAADDQIVIKHHGIYQQDDRDRREERDHKKLERDYSYMARLRLPGGDVSPEQWLAIQHIVDASGNGVVKITTRQTVQIHGVIKSKLKPTVQWFYEHGMDTIAACGDVNRNVAAGSNPGDSSVYEEAHAYAKKISEHLLPKTRAWHQIWIDEEKLEEPAAEQDPLYQDRYLPRKFKIGLAVPPSNDTDVLTNDLALIAITKDGKLEGFNVAIGGGMGTTHGSEETYPRLASMIGFAPKEQLLNVVWEIAAVQRDFGNREDRKLARLKYTVDRMTVDGFKQELQKRLGYTLEAERPFEFTERADRYEWQKDYQGKWFLTLFVENGRVVDTPDYAVKSALKEIAETKRCHFRFTSNQNIMIANVADEDKAAIHALLEKYGITKAIFSPTRTDSLACVALNTCPLALAEAQRYMPELLTKIETLLKKHGLLEQRISIRMTGCPNGCARPHTAEIGFIGRSLGHYNMYLAGGALGERLNRLYKENLNEAEILAALDPLLADYTKQREVNEPFGDYMNRIWEAA